MSGQSRPYELQIIPAAEETIVPFIPTATKRPNLLILTPYKVFVVAETLAVHVMPRCHWMFSKCRFRLPLQKVHCHKPRHRYCFVAYRIC